MEFRSSGCNKRLALAALFAAYATLTGGCLDSENGQTSNTGSSTLSTSSGGTTFGGATTGSSTPIVNYLQSQSVKVIFNKQGFYNNAEPNPFGCAGDARMYYDPGTDRQVPTQPLWLRNVAVDITNSNALNGPSLAAGCSLTGNGSAPPANCASFDDLQTLNGLQSRSVLIGGYGCSIGIAGCAPTSIIGDSWNLLIPDTSTGLTWTQQSSNLPPLVVTSVPGAVWAGGDFDELHNQYYLFGGAAPGNANSNPTTEGVFTNAVTRIVFNSDTTISTNPAPALLAANSRHFYGGWAKSGAFDSALNPYFPPQAMSGTTFTYGSRREPSIKSLCRNGDIGLNDFTSAGGGTGACTAASQTAQTPAGLDAAVSTNEDSDFYLLAGGMPSTGIISNQIYIFKPHSFSDDVGSGTADTLTPAGGDWNLVSNATSAPGVLSQKIMSVVDIGPGLAADIATTPFQGTIVGGSRNNIITGSTDIFTGWVGRAYHRTSYDPGMNRFYLYGGIESHLAEQLPPFTVPATTTTPDLSTSDVWIYDPPALGRRPTSICYTTETPDVESLPIGGGPALPVGSATGPLGVSVNLGASQNYATTKYVFPPGGCLQRIKLDGAMPPARFEHGQAFDRDLKRMYIFGGCNSPSVVHNSGTSNAGDPTSGCNTGQALMNDLWMYVPPTITEIVSMNTTTSTPGPFDSIGGLGLGNVWGTDFWLDHLPLYNAVDDPTSGPLLTPSNFQVMGGWVELTPASPPTPRVSASMTFDQAHHTIYLQGGWGCSDANCSSAPTALNDTWMYTPPLATDCPAPAVGQPFSCGTGGGSGQGTWTLINPNVAASNTTQPTQRYGALMSFANTQFASGDDFYTVTDSACQGEGPISSSDSSINKQYVGAIYVDIDRNQFPTTSNLLISLRYLPYDENTKLPGLFTNNNILSGQTDTSAVNDEAVVQVQLLNNSMSSATTIQSSTQPRFHEFISGTPVLANTFMYVGGPTGQLTEKQIFVPLELDPTINLIQIQRIQGSMKFYEMTVTVL